MMRTLLIWRVSFAALLALCCALPAVAADRAGLATQLAEAENLFRRANESVSSKPDEARDLYGKAALRFESIVREGGVENGGLYYDIGNAYFRMGDIGRAILNYRRAERYLPNDPNLHQNLEFARSKRADKIEEQQKTMVLKTLFFWHYDFSSRTRGVIFAVCFVLMWAFALVRLYVKRSFAAWGIGVSAAVMLLFLGSLLVEAAGERKERPGVVISAELVARKGDSEAYEPSFKEPLHAGTEFRVIEDRGKWYNIQLADSRQCWVPSTGVELVRQAR